MTKKIIVTTIILILLSAGISFWGIHPAHAATVWTVDLDANSTSQTDVSVQASCPSSAPLPGCPAQTKTFRVGAVINATAANPVNNVYGWQFRINYDPTVLTPQGDPNPAAVYPDGADATVMFGAQTTAGTVNWAGRLAALQAFGSSQQVSPGQLDVFFTLLPSCSCTGVTASAKTLLANIAFEIISKTPSSTSLALSYIAFIDQNTNPIPNIVPGAPTTGLALKSDSKIKYVNDTTSPSETWSPGKAVVYDTNNDGVYKGSDGDLVINGTNRLQIHSKIPRLRTDPNLRFVDTNNNGVWDPGEVVVYDSNGNGLYDAGEAVIAGSQVLETITNDPPRASFTVKQVSAYVFTFNATGSSDGDGTIANPGGYFWDFGDGTNDLGLTGPVILNHNYTLSGAPANFNVTLRVVDNLGATGSTRDALGGVIVNLQPSHIFKAVSANKPPIASFTFTPTYPTMASAVSFNASSSSDDGTISKYTWNFGDSTPVIPNATAPTHTFTAAGTYSVNLTVTDNQGATSSILHAVTVTTALTAGFTVNPTSPIAGLSATFTSTVTGGASPYVYSWNFGDGTPAGSSATTTHTYSSALTFTVTLTVTDYQAHQTTSTLSVTVLWLTAGFTINPTSPIQGQTSTFTSTVTGANSPFTYSWDFGDGSPAGSGQTTTHTYATIGLKTITLTVTDSLSHQTTSSMSASVVADSPPTVTFTVPAAATAGQSFTLNLTVSDADGSVTSLKIDWGDGNATTYTVIPSSAVHTYASSGNFAISVTATDNGGKMTSTTHTISVASAPPPPPQNSGLLSGPIPYVIIAIAAAAVIAVVVVRMRKRPGKVSTPGKP